MASEEASSQAKTEQAASKVSKKPFYLRPKVWLLTGLTVISLPLVLLVSVYFALNSSLVKKLVWPQIQPLLAEQAGFEVEIDDVRLSLFKRFYLKNLSAKQIATSENSDCATFELTLGELEANYALWPLITRKHLEISQIKLHQLNAEGCLLLDLDNQPEPPPEEDAAEFDLAASLEQLTELLNNPPLSFNLQNLELSDINLNLRVEEVNQQLSASWQAGFALQAKAAWQAEEITAQLTSQLTSYQPLEVELEQADTSQLQLFTQPAANLNFNLSLAKENDTWQLELEPTSSQINLDATQVALTQADEQLEVNLAAYQLNLTPSYAAGLVTTQLEQQLNQLSFSQTSNENATNQEIQLEEAQLNLTNQLELDVQQLNLQRLSNQLNLAVKGLATEHSHQPLDIQQQLDVTLNLQQETLQLAATTQLNAIQLAKLEANLSNPQQELRLNHLLEVNLPLELAEILTEPALKELPGSMSLASQGDTQLKHNFANLLAAKPEELEGWLNHASSFKLGLTQPTGDLQLTSPVTGNLGLTSNLPNYNPEIKLSLATDGLMHPPLLNPLPLEMHLDAQVNAGFDQLISRLKLLLDRQPTLDLHLYAKDLAQKLNFTSELDAYVPASLANYLAELEPLTEFGDFNIKHQLTSQLKHPYAGAQALIEQLQSQLDAEQELDLANITLDLNQQLDVKHQYVADAPVKLKQPLQLQQGLNWQADAVKAQVKLLAQQLEIPEQLNTQNLELNLTAEANSGLEPTAANAQINLLAQQLEIPEQLETKNLELNLIAEANSSLELIDASWQLTSKADKLTAINEDLALNALEALPLTSKGKVSFNPANQQLNIEEALVQLGELFYQQVSGLLDLQQFEQPNVQLGGLTQFTPKTTSHLLQAFGVQADGKLDFPWQLVVSQGKQLAFSGEPSFTNFNLSTADIALTDLNAQLNLSEELTLSADNKLSFRYLLSPEAFERVDFSQIEPFLSPTGNLSFSQFSLLEEGLTLGPLQAKLAVEQNLIEMPYFSLEALDGNLVGQFYFDLKPKNWRLGLLSRITQLDLRQLLADKTGGQHAPVSARTAVEFDFNQRLLTGRIDITDINRPQLLQLLEMVDPEYIDTQINQVRSALRLAHPEWISVAMQNGLMNIDFGLSLFSQPLRAHGLPLSPIIERFGEQALALPEELPLE